MPGATMARSKGSVAPPLSPGDEIGTREQQEQQAALDLELALEHGEPSGEWRPGRGQSARVEPPGVARTQVLAARRLPSEATAEVRALVAKR